MTLLFEQKVVTIKSREEKLAIDFKRCQNAQKVVKMYKKALINLKKKKNLLKRKFHKNYSSKRFL